MNPLLVHTSSNTSTVHTRSLYHQPRFDYNKPGTQLLDGVTKSFLGIDEWVAQELQRIEENQMPRNCYSYEALITVIEAVNQGGHYTVITEKPSPTLHETAAQCCMNPDDAEAPEPDSTLVLPQIQKINMDHSDHQKDISPPNGNKTNWTNDTLAKLATINAHQLTQRNLTMAFMKLVLYCNNQHNPIHFYLQRHRKPLELLIEIENMCDTYNSWASLPDISSNNKHIVDGIIKIQKRLYRILFGDQIPLNDKLVCPWTLISLWTQHGNQQQYNHCKHWIEFGIRSYQIAKKACGIGEINK